MSRVNCHVVTMSSLGTETASEAKPDRPEDPALQCSRSNASEIHPGDSVSQCASAVSSSVRAKAKRAALAAEVEALKELQELQLAELKLKQQKDALMLKTRLKVAEAEERVH